MTRTRMRIGRGTDVLPTRIYCNLRWFHLDFRSPDRTCREEHHHTDEEQQLAFHSHTPLPTVVNKSPCSDRICFFLSAESCWRDNHGVCAQVSNQQCGEAWEETRMLDIVMASPTRCVVITSGAPCAQDIASRLQALRHEHLTMHWRVPAGCAPCELVHCVTLAPQRNVPPIHEDLDVHSHHAASRPTWRFSIHAGGAVVSFPWNSGRYVLYEIWYI